VRKTEETNPNTLDKT